MLIKTASIQDAVDILQLQKTAFHNEAVEYADFSIPPMTQTLKSILQDFQNQIVLKAIQGPQIIGSVRGYTKDKTGYIGRLIVHPEWQGRGIGQQLMQSIEERLKEAGRYEIFTGHRSERTISLYQKLGYRIFRQEKVSDKLTMVYLEKQVKSDADHS